jgi:transposase
VVEHRARRYVQVSTGRIVTATLPDDVRRGGLLGPKLTGLIAYLKGPCHLSYRSIGLYFEEVMGLKLSVGMLAKAIATATEALAEPYEELLAVLPRQPVLGIDETGHRHRGHGCWAWCVHAPPVPDDEGLTCFVIDPSRGSSVVKGLLGTDYAGIILCDFFSAYRKCLSDMPDLVVQFCWAHLVRDVKFLAEHPDRVTQRYGLKVLAPVRKLFKLLARRDTMTDAGYRRAVERLRRAIRHAIRHAPDRLECWNLAERFRKHGDSYFTFIDRDDVPGVPGVDPTNNRTEQKIRFVVIDRKVTQGTKGEVGWQWCQRIWSTIATCRQRGKNVYQFLLDAIAAQLHDRPAPSLISA